jgi:hypothetical protein
LCFRLDVKMSKFHGERWKVKADELLRGGDLQESFLADIKKATSQLRRRLFGEAMRKLEKSILIIPSVWIVAENQFHQK